MKASYQFLGPSLPLSGSHSCPIPKEEQWLISLFLVLMLYFMKSEWFPKLNSSASLEELENRMGLWKTFAARFEITYLLPYKQGLATPIFNENIWMTKQALSGVFWLFPSGSRTISERFLSRWILYWSAHGEQHLPVYWSNKKDCCCWRRWPKPHECGCFCS